VKEFEAVYEKLWKPYRNKDNKQSDCVMVFFEIVASVIQKKMSCILFIIFVF